MGEPEWGDWIAHDGEHVPEGLAGLLVQAVACYADGAVTENTAVLPWDYANGLPSVIYWLGGGTWSGREFAAIKRYRIGKPRALLDLIEMVENLSDPISPMVPA